MSNIFMQIKGFKGNATAPGYKDWIEIDSLDFGAERPVRMTVGNLTDRDHGALTVDTVKLTKHIDNASNDLYMALFKADTFTKVEIHVCRGTTEMTPMAKFVLDNAMVASHHTSAATGTELTESLELGFTKLQRTYIARGVTNKEQSPNTVGYDLETAQAV